MNRWLIVAGDFTPLGGMDAANHALARYLAGRGDEIDLVTHRAWPDLEAMPTVTVRRVARPFGKHAFGKGLLSRAGTRAWRHLQPLGARAIVNGGNCSLAAINWVHYVHAAYEPSIAGSLARRSKTLVTHHRDVAAERRALLSARLVVCNSRRTMGDVVDRVGVDPARVRVVYYGSDPARFARVADHERKAAKTALGAPTDRPLVGFVGALGDRRKAFDTVFDAWLALCRTRGWDADLIVVGSGGELPAWRSRAEACGIADRIRFTGFRDDVPAVMAALDGFVHPARYEAYGLAPHEALCRGVPVIVSASAGVAEQFSPDLGELLLRDPGSGEELADRLSRWRSRLEHWRTAIKPVSDRLRARSWDMMAAEIASAAEAAA
ncbi:MAG TPA: glycosyltransferase family 4 protein [Vicinamibacterales bacterium]|nr:glycosyltransferase family 4 protein [Vicinamibacterales bacterium]